MTAKASLEAKIQRLEDMEAIKRVKYKYFRCIDRGLWDNLGECFAEQGVADYGGNSVLKGGEAITTYFKENIAPNFSICVHHGHNPEIDFTSETAATGVWQLESFLVSSQTNIGLWIAGYYEEEYIKEKGEWKLNRLKVTLEFASDIEKGWAKERFCKSAGF
ncbi:nuclear transport factor 2 family protein [Thermodesulfobacteriota bacterium]